MTSRRCACIEELEDSSRIVYVVCSHDKLVGPTTIVYVACSHDKYVG